jgi:hypothetical protein
MCTLGSAGKVINIENGIANGEYDPFGGVVLLHLFSRVTAPPDVQFSTGATTTDYKAR